MKYDELKKAYTQSPVVFNGALLAVFTHGSETLKKADARTRFKVEGNIIAPELQTEMLNLACELAATSFNDLMAFVKQEIVFHFSSDFAPGLDAEGICPVCGGSIEYGGENNIDDDGGTCPWTCPDCGATGKEGYNRAFDQHYDVRTADGKKFPPDETEDDKELED